MRRHIARLLSLIALAATGVGGLYNTTAEWPDAATPLQHVVSAGELGYGVFGVAAAVGLARRRRWSVRAAALWAAAVTTVAALAPPAYGGPSVTIAAAVGAGLATAALSALVVWGAHASTAPPRDRAVSAPG